MSLNSQNRPFDMDCRVLCTASFLSADSAQG